VKFCISNYEKTRQAKYVHVTLRHFLATTVATEKQRVLHKLCVCVFVALGIHQAVRIRHTVIRGLSGCTKCFYIMS